MLTCPSNVDLLTAYFCIVNLGFTGGYSLFSYFALKHRLWVIVRTASFRRSLELPHLGGSNVYPQSMF